MYSDCQTIKNKETNERLLLIDYSKSGLICIDESGKEILIDSDKTDCIVNKIGDIEAGKYARMSDNQIRKLYDNNLLLPDTNLDASIKKEEILGNIEQIAKEYVDSIRNDTIKSYWIGLTNENNYKREFWELVIKFSDNVYRNLFTSEETNLLHNIFIRIGKRIYVLRSMYYLRLSEVILNPDFFRIAKDQEV